MRIQFILKKNEVYSFVSYTRRSSGLWNSTKFIVEALKERGVDAEIVEVVDNNCIDREVTRFKPDLVVIEALWVVPEKFDVLRRLHPSVRWHCHLHSDIPFLALEGIAMDWIKRYPEHGVGLIANSYESYRALRAIVGKRHIAHLPNVYRSRRIQAFPKERRCVLNVACLGAIRPMKNQLLQALAAIKYARQTDRTLHFFVNATRVETGGEPVLKNLRQLFAETPNAHLIELPWMEREHMIVLLNRDIDIGMQVSLTETFNVVTADYVSAGIPVVVSKEVKWASRWSHALDNSIDDIVAKMHRAESFRGIIDLNQWLLKRSQKRAEEMWWCFTAAQVAAKHVQAQD